MAFEQSLSKLFPLLPLSENELHDSYTRLCNFPIYIKECLSRELGWTKEEFFQRVLPPLAGYNHKGLNEAETIIVRAVIKARLKMFTQYLEDAPELVCSLRNSSNQCFGGGATNEQRADRL
ncbi:hypothetical protein MMC2321_02308 [Chitinophaga sp. MM2321]